MASINSVTLMGNLGQDPKLMTTKAGKSWCKFTLATNSVMRAENGEKRESTTWHNVKVYGKSAESCHAYLRKGRSALIEGRIETSKFKKDDGSDGYWTEIVARNVSFIGGPRESIETLPTANDVPF